MRDVKFSATERFAPGQHIRLPKAEAGKLGILGGVQGPERDGIIGVMRNF